jgi:hypothetical protein
MRFDVPKGGPRPGSGRPPGRKNLRTREIEAAMAAVGAAFKEAVPEAFDGDGVALLQTIYRNPSIPMAIRIDAASKAARYERPSLMAVATKDLTPTAPVEIEDTRIPLSQLIDQIVIHEVEDDDETPIRRARRPPEAWQDDHCTDGPAMPLAPSRQPAIHRAAPVLRLAAPEQPADRDQPWFAGSGRSDPPT